MNIIELNEDQKRQSIEIDDLYEGWLFATQKAQQGRFRWKERSGRDYLCLLPVGSDTGRGMGVRSAHTEALYEQGRANEAQVAETWKRLLLKGRMFKAARLPTVPEFVGKALRELDTRQLLGKHLRVIGSTALPAYEMEAGIRFPSELLATEDFDLSWVANAPRKDPPESLIHALKAADSTWTVTDRGFQLRNRAGYTIDVIIAQELVAGYPSGEPVLALPTVGQEWLLGGMPVSHVVVDTNGKPARIVAPDPRLFALHKLFVSEQPGRSAIKRHKDIAQANAVLDIVVSHMPHYPLDEAFEATLGPEMLNRLHEWRAARKPASSALSRGRGM